MVGVIRRAQEHQPDAQVLMLRVFACDATFLPVFRPNGAGF
jgi:hypothetical protein